MAAQREAEEPLDALPSTSAPLLPDLSDDRKSNDGLPKPGDGVFEPALGLEKPPPDLETAPEQEALGLALDEVARSVSKEGLAKLGEGCGNPGLTTPRCDEEGPGDRNVDELQTGQVRSTEGEEKGSGDAVISNPSAARSGEGSSMEPSSGNPLATSETGKAFGMEKSPPLEPLSKRGSNESVTAEAKQPPGKASSGSAFLRALAGGLSFAQPSSLSKPPKTETAERPAQSGLLGKTAPETGGSSNKGAEKGGAEAGLDMSAPVPSSGTPSGYLPDVSMSFGGVQSEQVPRGGVSLQAEGRSSVHSTGGRGSGPDLEAFPAGGEVGRKTSASPPLPLSLSLLHTIATEFCSDPPSAEFGANRDHVKMDQGKGDVSKRAGGDNASGIDHRGVNKGRDDGGVKMDAMMRGGVNGDGVPWGGVNGDGLQQLGTSRSLPLNPWLSLRPQSLQRNLSAPMQTSVPPQQSGLEFFNLGTGLSAPKQANPVQNQTANPGPHLSQNPSLNALPKGSPFAKDGLNQDPFNPRSTSRQTSSGDDLSFGPIWRQEGLLNANPALDAVSRKPRPFGGAPGQTFVPLQNGGSQNLLGSHGLPNTLWGDSANRGPVPPSMPWLPERNLSGAYPNQGLDVSLSLQPSAPPRTVKPETGMYNVYRGSGRRGSVSLHIGPLPVVDAVTAAEARKRRREVTKSKFGPSGGPSAKVQKVAGAKAAR